MRLDRLAKDISVNDHDEKTIDFGSAGLYIPALQTVFATTFSACVSVLAAWVIPASMVSAVRTLALAVSAAFLVVRRPVRIGSTRGVFTIFSALRPCPFLYLTVLVLEQLVHACINEETIFDHSLWRQILYHVCIGLMILSGFARSGSPRAETDRPFFVSGGAFLAIAMFPPPALALSGPLCSSPSLLAAGERVLRAFLFSCVYTVLVYASAPISSSLADTLVCIARSTAASGWVLGCTVFALPLTVMQVVLILYCSFSPVQTQYDQLGAAKDDLESNTVAQAEPLASTNGAGPLKTASPEPDYEEEQCVDEDDRDVQKAVLALKAQRANFNAMEKGKPKTGNGFFQVE